jgi:hypothetical protein
MMEEKPLENIKISKHLGEILDQLESVIIFDKNSGNKSTEAVITKNKASESLDV